MKLTETNEAAATGNQRGPSAPPVPSLPLPLLIVLLPRFGHGNATGFWGWLSGQSRIRIPLVVPWCLASWNTRSWTGDACTLSGSLLVLVLLKLSIHLPRLMPATPSQNEIATFAEIC